MDECVVESIIDIATDEFLPRLERRVCKKCDLAPICKHFETSCRPLPILEQLFLLGRISYKEATVGPRLPDPASKTKLKVPKALIASIRSGEGYRL